MENTVNMRNVVSSDTLSNTVVTSNVAYSARNDITEVKVLCWVAMALTIAVDALLVYGCTTGLLG